jgi:hypothetical protein
MSFVDFNSFDGNYVILTSDRLILNSKSDSVFISSKKTIGFSAVEQIHFNVGPLSTKNPEKNYLIINSPLIQLGLPENYGGERNEPVAKAHATIEFVNAVIKALNSFCDSIASAKGIGVGTVALAELNVSASNLKQQLTQLTKNYSNIETSKINSKTTKTV